MTGTTDEQKRKALKRHYQECERIYAIWEERGHQKPLPPLPEMPDELKALTCGAKTRAGTPCKSKAIYRNGRCKLHGGLSTGPKTIEGKRRSALNTGKTYEQLTGATTQQGVATPAT